MDQSPIIKQANFYAQFTGFVVTWNGAEMFARLMLSQTLGATETSQAVAADMGNRSLTEGLRAAAREPRFKHVRERIDHFVDGYDRILPYRNYYVHALGQMVAGEATLLSLAGKGRLKFHSETLTADQLNTMMNHTMALVRWGGAILQELGSEMPALAAYAARFEASAGKPEWPEPLKKLPHYMQAP